MCARARRVLAPPAASALAARSLAAPAYDLLTGRPRRPRPRGAGTRSADARRHRRARGAAHLPPSPASRRSARASAESHPADVAALALLVPGCVGLALLPRPRSSRPIPTFPAPARTTRRHAARTAWARSDGSSRRPRSPRRGAARLHWSTASAPAASAGVGVFLAGPSLGHRHSAQDIAGALGATAWSRRCVVRYDRSIPRRHALRTAQDCDVRVSEMLGVRACLGFASAARARSRSWRGAHIHREPWRAEVCSTRRFRPVLKRARARRGAVRVGRAGTLLPVPGARLAEGDGDRTRRARCWRRGSPRASRQQPRVLRDRRPAYAAAGSILPLAARHPRRFARSARATSRGSGRDLVTLEREWRALRVAVPDAVVARAGSDWVPANPSTEPNPGAPPRRGRLQRADGHRAMRGG